LTLIETKFCQKNSGYVLFDDKSNEEILEKFKVESVYCVTTSFTVAVYLGVEF